MKRKKVRVTAVSLLIIFGLGLPALAHGDHDARALFSEAEIGPYTVTLWQVSGDQDSPRSGHFIVGFDGEEPSAGDRVAVSTDNDLLPASPSSSSSGSWVTQSGAQLDQAITVAIETSEGQWALTVVTAPGLVSGSVPMEVLLTVASLFTAAAAYWLALRTPRVFRNVTISGTEKSMVRG